MPQYEYFCHSCQKAFSKILTLQEYEEGEVACPDCGRPLLDKFRITADGEGLLHEVNALAAYSCVEEGHIFFVRLSDLERVDSFRAAASSTVRVLVIAATIPERTIILSYT